MLSVHYAILFIPKALGLGSSERTAIRFAHLQELLLGTESIMKSLDKDLHLNWLNVLITRSKTKRVASKAHIVKN